MTMKVYGYDNVFIAGVQHRAIVAAPSRTAAGRSFGISDHTVRAWAYCTANVDDVAIAVEPGQVWVRALDDHTRTYTKATLVNGRLVI